MEKRTFAVTLIGIAFLLVCVLPALADGPLPQDDLALAQRYAPVLYFHSEEVFRPQPVEVIVRQARLRQARRLWFDANVLLYLDVSDLLHLPVDQRYFLDVWYGTDGSSAYTNYSAHQSYYRSTLSPEAGGPPVTAYARVARERDRITIQYWLFYFYNDWFNKHEGDWEMVQVMLTADGEPEWVVLSQHHGGTRRAWAHTLREEETHPVVYVARGSHANYFVGDEVYPNGKDVGRVRVEILDRTGRAGRAVPRLILIPDRETLWANPAAWPGAEWLSYRGHWGQIGVQADFSGPLGPADKGAQWETPYDWGMRQPLDTDVWYANRLRVEVVGATPQEAQVYLKSADGNPLPGAEELGNLAILHSDPPPDTPVLAEIRVPSGTAWDINVAVPDPVARTVSHYRFISVRFGETGRATVICKPGDAPTIQVEGADAAPIPLWMGTKNATWDAPDIVWIGTILPAHQVASGLLIAVLASVIPTFLYVGTLYWLDRYEKEPKRLLGTAFVWGAIPSVLLTLGVELFFPLPPDLIGPRVTEAIRLGLFAPFVEEALKGAVVLYIARRYRYEFDNVLDGIIYGAMVGFGFAMTGNLISYAGSFLLWGFEGLNASTFIEGVIYALNHAFYTAIFGAALGYGRLARKPLERRGVPMAGFIAAALVHGAHKLLAGNMVGMNALTAGITLAGVIVIAVVAAWALVRERQCLQAELRGVVPEALYQALTVPGGRARARWQALRSGGIRAWRQTGQLHRLCVELAFKRMQARVHPDEPDTARRAAALEESLRQLLTNYKGF